MYFADTAFDLEAYSVFTEYIVCTNLKSVQTYIIHTHTHTHTHTQVDDSLQRRIFYHTQGHGSVVERLGFSCTLEVWLG